jgi:hypothetical protein
METRVLGTTAGEIKRLGSHDSWHFRMVEDRSLAHYEYVKLWRTETIFNQFSLHYCLRI